MSLDTNALVGAVKQAAVEAVRAEKPMAICFGKVLSASPLSVQVDQKLTLSATQLVLTSLVSDFEAPITMSFNTENYYFTGAKPPEGGTAPVSPSHKHAVTGKKTIKVHLGLSAGESVILMRADGGQKYIILDRVRG